MMLPIFGLSVLAVGWTILVRFTRRDLRLASFALMAGVPLAVGLLLPGADKAIVAGAGVAAAGGLVVGAVRARGAAAASRSLRGHPLLPFTLLYATCGVYGLMWALWRGNDIVLVLGQTWTAVLFVLGFVVAGPLAALQATVGRWLAGVLAIAALCLPALAALVTWATAGDGPQLVRFLAPSAFYAPVGALLALAIVAPCRRAAGWALAGFLAFVTLLTFTRSYWLGLLVGLLVLCALLATTRWGRPLPRPRLPRRGEAAWAAAGTVVLVALLAFTPIAQFALDRGAQTRRGAGDLSVEVRSLELEGALRQVATAPISGVGSGGQFVALRQLDSERVFFGPTNFIHNAYLYFPLKFGVLGFAALFALAGGLVVLLARAVRTVRREGLRAVAFVPAAIGVLTLSVTAPNLVDPTFSLFAGALLFLAGARSPLPSEAPCRV